MFSFIIPSGLFECQSNMGLKETTHLRDGLGAIVGEVVERAACSDVIIREGG
jgi:hypothetical protein